MALLGKAAMLLSFDIAPEAVAEHDDWHTHEHFPERLSIPGFRRGSRWIAREGGSRYFVMYEVERLETLASAAYLERLNNPTPWTAKMMVHYRGMKRGLCSIAGSFGAGLGQAGLLVRFKPAAGRQAALRKWLLEEELPALPAKPGLASACLFESALAPQSTSEQRIRGSDAPVDWALLVTGYEADGLAALAAADLRRERFEQQGATGYFGAIYRIAYALEERELRTPGPSQRAH